MGNQKLKWTAEEEEALKAGVAKHGAGKWKNIVVDSEFAHKLANRSNVDLKDKWRNMGANGVQGCRANALTPKGKATATSSVPPKTLNSSSAFVSKDNVNDKPPQSPQEVTNALKYYEMILEALSSIKDINGSDFGTILGFIEVQKRYKIKHATLGSKTPTPKQKDVRSRPLQESKLTVSTETLEDATVTAAYKIGEAENKSFVAAEAVKESERVSQIAEEADAMLMCLKKIFEQWEGKGDKNSEGSLVEAILVL